MRTMIGRLVVTTLAAVAVGASASAPASADLTFVPGSVTGELSSPRAGSHADFRTSFVIGTDDTGEPGGTARRLDVALPKGMLGDPTAYPTCTMARVNNPYGAAGPCPADTAIGSVAYQLRADGTTYPPYTVLLYNVKPQTGEPAAFGFNAIFFPVKLSASVRSDGDYGISATIEGLTEGQPLVSADVTLWGVPADRQGPGDQSTVFGDSFGGPGDAPRRPFITSPSECTGRPLETVYSATAWRPQTPQTIVEKAFSPAVTGCEQLSFAPEVSVEPTTRVAGAPSGYRIDIDVPQNDDPDGQATPPIKDAKVVLPEGTAISPPAAHGLEACSDEQFGASSKAAEQCPLASKIGTVRVNTPLLADPLEGSAYLASQRSGDPESGEMYRMFLVVSGSGVRVKLRGAIRADARTGQLTTTFADNPQLPFSKLSLELFGGDRAPLVNAPTCGTKAAVSTISSWGGQSRDVSTSFALDQGCPSGQFAPGFTAGTLNPFAGAYSPFVMTTTRSDADQDLSKIHLDLPSGLLGALGTVPVCAEAQAAAGSCAGNTRLGSTTVAVGSGAHPFSLGGTVSLAGPYKGQPYSLAIAVPAKAGPLDLGMVVVRAPLVIDASNAKVSAPVDDLPQIVGGVPLRYRSISVALDRPGFMWNATNCTAQEVNSRLTSVGGAVALPAARYQAQGCDKLEVDPHLALRYANKAELKKDKHPAIEADLKDTFGHANLKTVAVTLPLTASLDPDNANALCEPNAAAARSCPAESIVGWASASTIALHEPLTGPVYFVRGERKNAAGKTVRTLPKLYLRLRGSGVEIDLHADSDVKDDHLVTTFRNIPDVPLQDFKLRLNGGKNGIIVAVNDPCAASKDTTAVFTGHNGGVTRRALKFTAPECAPAISTATGSATKVTVRVGGIGPGRLTISGSRVRTARRTIKASDAAQLTARTRLTTTQKRLLARGRSVKVAVRVTFKPKAGGKTVAFKRTITIKGVRRSSRR